MARAVACDDDIVLTSSMTMTSVMDDAVVVDVSRTSASSLTLQSLPQRRRDNEDISTSMATMCVVNDAVDVTMTTSTTTRYCLRVVFVSVVVVTTSLQRRNDALDVILTSSTTTTYVVDDAIDATTTTASITSFLQCRRFHIVGVVVSTSTSS